MRMRILPTEETKARIRSRESYMRALEQKELEAIEARRLAQDRLLEIEHNSNEEGEAPAVIDTSPKSRSRKQSVTIAINDRHLVKDTNSDESCSCNKANRDYSQYLDLVFTAQRSWSSQSLQILPGDYYLLANVELNLSFLESMRLSLPRDVADAPWIDSSIVAAVQQSQELSFSDAIPEELSLVSETSVQKLEKQLFSPGSKSNRSPIKHLNEDVEIRKHQFDHSVWVEVSGIDEITLSLVRPSIDLISEQSQSDHHNHSMLETAKPGLYKHATLPHSVSIPNPIFPDVVQHEKWPFLAESQEDVCSRELVKIMSTIRDEAEQLGEEFISLATKFREEKKRLISAHKAKK
jgi:hypothetical protein